MRVVIIGSQIGKPPHGSGAEWIKKLMVKVFHEICAGRVMLVGSA
ncbi:hypothetical protein ABIC35_001485 [Sphingomonas trueperi]